jgi:hypothetical protein
MNEKISLEMLNINNVIVLYQTLDSDGYVLKNHRVGYDNSLTGRKRVEEEVVEPYKSVIFMMWGDEPTINEDIAQ